MIDAERKDVLKNIGLALLATAVLLLLERTVRTAMKERANMEAVMQGERWRMKHAMHVEEGKPVMSELRDRHNFKNLVSDLVGNDARLVASIQSIDRTIEPHLGDRRYGAHLANPWMLGDGRRWGRRGVARVAADLNKAYSGAVDDIIRETGNRYNRVEVWNAIIENAVEGEHDHHGSDGAGDADTHDNMAAAMRYF